MAAFGHQSSANKTLIFPLLYNMIYTGACHVILFLVLLQGAKVCACCAYKDVSGIFSTEKVEHSNNEVQLQVTTPTTPKV